MAIFFTTCRSEPHSVAHRQTLAILFSYSVCPIAWWMLGWFDDPPIPTPTALQTLHCTQRERASERERELLPSFFQHAASVGIQPNWVMTQDSCVYCSTYYPVPCALSLYRQQKIITWKATPNYSANRWITNRRGLGLRLLSSLADGTARKSSVPHGRCGANAHKLCLKW